MIAGLPSCGTLSRVPYRGILLGWTLIIDSYTFFDILLKRSLIGLHDLIDKHNIIAFHHHFTGPVTDITLDFVVIYLDFSQFRNRRFLWQPNDILVPVGSYWKSIRGGFQSFQIAQESFQEFRLLSFSFW